MPNYDATMEKLVRGNDRDVIRDVSGLPTGIVLTDAWLRVNAPNGSSQLFEKHITTTLVAGEGQIEDAGAGDGVGRIRFEMTAVNTLTMTGGTNAVPTEHAYGIQVKTSGGKIYEDELGTIPCLEQIVVSS